ncbi:Sensory transduction protein regX3 [compost metagenome]
MDQVWTNEAEFVDENALTVTVKRLRSKIEEDPATPKYIKTVYGLGYMWAEGVSHEKQ